jgi:hypothetical protein
MTAMRNALTDEEYAEQAENGEPEKSRWSQQEQLLAGISDGISELTYIYNCSHIESKSKWPKRPDPMKRPGIRALKPKQKITPQQADHLWSMLNPGAA